MGVYSSRRKARCGDQDGKRTTPNCQTPVIRQERAGVMRRPAVAADIGGAAAGKMKQRDKEEGSPQIKVTLGTGVDLLPGLYQSTWRGRKSQQERHTRCQSRFLTEEGGLSLVDGQTARRGR